MKCYKYNKQACCTAVHDDYISNKVKDLLTDSCIRKYQKLEDLFCLGCNPAESKYLVNNKLRICSSFLEALWNTTEVNSPTKTFDNCGFKISENLAQYNLTDRGYIIPSKVIHSLYLI